MEYYIPSLETSKVLKLAKELDILEVNEMFVFKSNMKWVRPFGMLFAAFTIKQFRAKYPEIPFKMDYRKVNDSVSYASHMGFYKTISENINIGKVPGEAIGNDFYLPITELDFDKIQMDSVINSSMTEMGDIIEKKSSELAKILSGNNKEFHILLTYLIREMLRNIPEHAECRKAWICGQSWNDGTAEIAILDEGIGVLKSLQRNKIHNKFIKNDLDAITNAIRAGISRAFDPSKNNSSNEMWANSGFGLYMASEICKELNGSFCLVSGKNYIYINENGSIVKGDTVFQGTSIKMTISTSSLKNSKEIISKIAEKGEIQAKAIRNAFKKASIPSKGFIEKN